LEWTGSLGGGGRISSGVIVGGVADAASDRFCHNWLSKKSEGAQGIATTAKVPGGSFQKLSIIKRRKEQRVVVVAIAKEPRSLKFRSGETVLQLRH